MKSRIHSSAARKLPWLALCGLCLLIRDATVSVRADIVIRLSVKAVLDPATGLRGTGVTEAAFSNALVAMNAYLARTGRGYRYEWVGNRLIDVGGLGQTNFGPSQYYEIDFDTDPNAAALKDQFENDAVLNFPIYGWDFTAVNIYFVKVNGGHASFPPQRIILLSESMISENNLSSLAGPRRIVHETGHHFNLKHTHQGEKYKNSDGSDCTAEDCSCANLVGGNADLVADTIPDHQCWDAQDAIAQGNYGLNYAGLTSARQAAVDRVWLNLMSYHGSTSGYSSNFFTSDQLDRWTDSANHDRPNEVSGLTRFVDLNNSCLAQNGSSACVAGAGGPFPTIANGISHASAGDIVLIRPGHYNEPMTITKAITLRATRGDALVGIP
jgi:hypothetical protein